MHINHLNVTVAQLCPTPCDPMDYIYSPWNSPGQNTGVGSFPSPGDLTNPGIEPRSPTLQADSLPAEPSGKLKNNGMCSLSLLQVNLTDPGIRPGSPALQVDSLPADLIYFLYVDLAFCDLPELAYYF